MDLDPSKYTHEPDHHKGDCIYCDWFDYNPEFWNQPCKEHLRFRIKEVVNRPAIIRAKITGLIKELEAAEAHADQTLKNLPAGIQICVVREVTEG